MRALLRRVRGVVSSAAAATARRRWPPVSSSSSKALPSLMVQRGVRSAGISEYKYLRSPGFMATLRAFLTPPLLLDDLRLLTPDLRRPARLGRWTRLGRFSLLGRLVAWGRLAGAPAGCGRFGGAAAAGTGGFTKSLFRKRSERRTGSRGALRRGLGLGLG